MIGDLTWEIGVETDAAKSIQNKLWEFMDYVMANLPAIPNYANRYRHGEPIATGFVESAANQVASKRFVKRQQMRWSPQGAHELLMHSGSARQWRRARRLVRPMRACCPSEGNSATL